MVATGGVGGRFGLDDHIGDLDLFDKRSSAGVFATGGAATVSINGGIGVFAKGGAASGSDRRSGVGLRENLAKSLTAQETVMQQFSPGGFLPAISGLKAICTSA